MGIEVTGLKVNLDNMLKQKDDAVTGLTAGDRVPDEEAQGDRVHRRRPN